MKSGSPMFRKIIGESRARRAARQLAPRPWRTPSRRRARCGRAGDAVRMSLSASRRAARAAATSAGRRSAAALSSTPLTYLWPSVPPKLLASSTAFVDRHLVRDVDAVLQLVHADHQHAVFDRRQLGWSCGRHAGPAARRGRRPRRCSRAAARRSAPRRTCRSLPARACGRRSRRRRRRRHQPFVQALQRDFARAAAGRLAPRPCLRGAGAGLAAACGGLRSVVGHDRSSIRLAISTATRAASRPLSSARAQACASFSTVRMALAIGSWWSSDTRVTPAPLSLATSSKW